MAKRSRVNITMSPLIVIDQEDDQDLDLWEVINPSDGDYSDDSFSVDSLSDDDVISLDDASFISPSTQIEGGELSAPPHQILDGGDLVADLDLGSGVDQSRDEDDDDDKDVGSAQRRKVLLRGGVCKYSVGITYGNYVDRECFHGEIDEDRDDDYDDSYDLEEEMVPRSVSKKIGKQRMRKLGKRGIGKVFASKKFLYSNFKHGFVSGKHGFDMKLKY